LVSETRKLNSTPTTLVTLVTSVRHASAKLNAFTETGGPTPLSTLAKTVTRTRVHGGAEVARHLNLGGITIAPRVYIRAASDSGDASRVADLGFTSASTDPTLQAIGLGSTVEAARGKWHRRRAEAQGRACAVRTNTVRHARP
jgi:Autotransporter beta-domain